jgi:HEAT repeat protein
MTTTHCLTCNERIHAVVPNPRPTNRGTTKWLLGFPCLLLAAVAAAPAEAGDYAPLPDYVIADAVGQYYVVWQRLGGPTHFGEWGPTAFTVAERAPNTPPVRSAQAYIENLGRYEPDRGGQHYRMLENPEVAVRPGDVVHGRGVFETPPRVVLVSSRGLGFVTLDLYGPNLPFVCDGLGGHAVVAVSLEGKLRVAKTLSDLFTEDQIGRFPSNGASISWLRGGWINEGQAELVLLGAGNELRVVNLVSGHVRQGDEQDVVRGLDSQDPEAVKQALIIAADRRLPSALEPARKILDQGQRPPGVRLRAAVALAVLGDQRGAELIRTSATRQPQALDPTAWDREFQRAVAIEYLPEAIGRKALPLLADALRNGRAEQSAAFKALVKLEEESVPTLSGMVAAGNERRLRMAAIGILGQLGPTARAAAPQLAEALEDEEPLVRIKAAFALVKMDPRRPHLAPVLRAGLRFDESAAGYFPVREAAAECLGQLGPDGLSILGEALEDPDAEVRRVAVSALWRLGAKAVAAGPSLVRRLGDGDRDVRNRALAALVNMGPACAATLTDGLESEEASVRAGCAFALGRLGPAASTSVPALESSLDDDDPLVRATAAAALAQVDPNTTAGVETLMQLLEHRVEYVRAAAAVGLEAFGPRAHTARGRLIESLGDREKVAVSAASALSAVAPDDPQAARALILALKRPERLVRRAAVESLGRFPSAGAEVVPALIDRLDDPDWHVPHLAATALGEIGPKASAAVPVLSGIVRDRRRNNSLRLAAVAALGRLARRTSPDRAATGARVRDPRAASVPALIAVLGDPCAEVADEAVKTLATLGPEAVAGLRQALSSSKRQARVRAARALGKIGAAAQPAVPALIDALADADPSVGFYSEGPLLAVGPGAVDGLIAALRDQRADVRAHAARILGRLAPENARSAVDALSEALRDDDSEVRRQAAYALGAIGAENGSAAPDPKAALQDDCPSRSPGRRRGTGIKD